MISRPQTTPREAQSRQRFGLADQEFTLRPSAEILARIERMSAGV